MILNIFNRFTLQGTITYPTKREKENHRLKSAFFLGGYVSSQEGSHLWNLKAGHPSIYRWFGDINWMKLSEFFTFSDICLEK